MTCGSLCDTCRAPGRCCTGFVLGGGDFARGETMLGALVALATVEHYGPMDWSRIPSRKPGETLEQYTDRLPVQSRHVGLPFMPLHVDRYGSWQFWCPLLGRDGRCTDYENRPPLCREYQPGTDKLCAEWQPRIPESGVSLLKAPLDDAGAPLQDVPGDRRVSAAA